MKAFSSDARSTRLALLAALALLPGFGAPAVAATRPVAAQQAADPIDTVSGDVRMTTHEDHALRIKTISGDMIVSGADGDVQVKTVSGDTELTLGSLTSARIESVSGDVKVSSTLAPSGQFDASSISGDLHVKFAAQPDADIDGQSFSGSISNCFGPKPTEPHYGPGSLLNFRSGKGGRKAHLDTKSGDVSVCTVK